MKKHKKSIIGVVLMVLITLGVYILFKGDGNSVFTGDDTTQAVEFNDINLNEEKDGKVIWNLKARHVKMESDRNTAYLTDIEGFFAEDGNELIDIFEQGKNHEYDYARCFRLQALGLLTGGITLYPGESQVDKFYLTKVGRRLCDVVMNNRND